MTCHQAQINLSLYLYGELDFAEEEEIERHLSECAFCGLALAREKAWHSTLNSEQKDAPLDLLDNCRQDLKTAISSASGREARPSFRERWLDLLGIRLAPVPLQVAIASFLVFVGFSVGRWMDRNGMLGNFPGSGETEMGLLGPGVASHIRGIQPDNNDQVRIIFDQVRQREVVGRIDDSTIRQLLLKAVKDPFDPGVRVDSVEVLSGQNGDDVRDALLDAAEHDANPGVRVKALEGLQAYVNDPQARDGLKFVLEHDSNPGVRTEAIDLLAPQNPRVELDPSLAGTLQDILRFQQDDDYVRARCLQTLHDMNAIINNPTIDVY